MHPSALASSSWRHAAVDESALAASGILPSPMLSTILFVLATTQAPKPAIYRVKPFRGDVKPTRVSAPVAIEPTKTTPYKIESIGLPLSKPKGYPF